MNTKIEIKEYKDFGYKSVFSYDAWRVAILNYIDELLPINIDNFQAHLNTDEVFVLLEGKCILYTADITNNHISNIEGLDMERGKIYNVKKGVYHTHTLSKDAKVLIVENDDTSDDNSPKFMIDKDTNNILLKIKNELWK